MKDECLRRAEDIVRSLLIDEVPKFGEISPKTLKNLSILWGMVHLFRKIFQALFARSAARDHVYYNVLTIA